MRVTQVTFGGRDAGASCQELFAICPNYLHLSTTWRPRAGFIQTLPALSAFNLRKYLTDPAGVWYNRRPTGKYFHRSTTWWSALISSNYYWSVGAGEDLTKLHLIRGNLQIRLDIVPVLVYNGAGQILHRNTTTVPGAERK